MTRLLDIIAALCGLVLLAPVFAAVAVSVKLNDGGPVFFSQSRVGRFGRHFRMQKFRTMTPDAEQQGLPLTVAGDARITRIGEWLRRAKLDELPQLWNVAKGEMSLVGPRPEVPRYVALYTPAQRRVLDVRPGITDPASLEFIDEASVLGDSENSELHYLQFVLPRKLAINLEYLRRRTIASDIAVILATLWRLAELGGKARIRWAASCEQSELTPPTRQKRQGGLPLEMR